MRINAAFMQQYASKKKIVIRHIKTEIAKMEQNGIKME